MFNRRSLVTLIGVLALVLLAAYLDNKYLHLMVPLAIAHCDTMGGPVVQDAQQALETGNIDLVLKWVRPDDEAAIRKAFEQTLEVRKLGPKAKEMADRYFFETLVRIHRAGEGVAYTGIMPAGAEVEPGIEAADQAVATGNGDALAKDVSGHIARTIRERFARVIDAKRHMNESVAAGREYVEAYVAFIHYVEKLHQLASGEGDHHGDNGSAKPHQH
jgi:hypothetical protein